MTGVVRRFLAVILLAGSMPLRLCAESATPADDAPVQHADKKVLYINAYHAGYGWSDAEQQGIEKVLKGAGVQYQAICMDSKRRKKPDEIQAAAKSARAAIETFKPDVVIVSDDNPVAHVIVPWYKNTALPFVFCGVNWDCAAYGLPCSNVTGMLEVSLFPQMAETLYPLARGRRVALLSNDNETDHLEGKWIPRRCQIAWAGEKYVTSFADWKKAYLELQDQSDMLFLYGTAGIADWNEAEALKFVQENTRVITCSTQYYMKTLVVVGYMKSGEEQGNWAAHTALRILEGTPPSAIPVTENKISIITLNMGLARRLGVVFPLDLLKHAELIK